VPELDTIAVIGLHADKTNVLSNVIAAILAERMVAPFETKVRMEPGSPTFRSGEGDAR
jgi:hypothetical protein